MMSDDIQEWLDAGWVIDDYRDLSTKPFPQTESYTFSAWIKLTPYCWMCKRDSKDDTVCDKCGVAITEFYHQPPQKED